MDGRTESWIVSALQEAGGIPLDDCVYPSAIFQEDREQKIGEMTVFLLQLFTYLYRMQRSAAEMHLQLSSANSFHEMEDLEEKLAEMMVRSQAFETLFWSEVCAQAHLWSEPVGVRKSGEIVHIPRSIALEILPSSYGSFSSS